MVNRFPYRPIVGREATRLLRQYSLERTFIGLRQERRLIHGGLWSNDIGVVTIGSYLLRPSIWRKGAQRLPDHLDESVVGGRLAA